MFDSNPDTCNPQGLIREILAEPSAEYTAIPEGLGHLDLLEAGVRVEECTACNGDPESAGCRLGEALVSLTSKALE